jgi:hypothetical protein
MTPAVDSLTLRVGVGDIVYARAGLLLDRR